MGLVSGWSLANHFAWPVSGLTQGPSWWRAHCSTEMDSSEKDSGRLVGHMDWRLLFPFDLSRIIPVGGWVRNVSSTFLTRTSCCKITHASGYYCVWPGRVVSVCGSPNRSTLISVGSPQELEAGAPQGRM